MQEVVEKAVAIARGELNTPESGENRGQRVDEYQRADTLPGVGYPWCASFVAWVLKQTATALKTEIPWNASASCDVVWAYARSQGLIRSEPKPGDVFLVRARLKNGVYSHADAIHTGFVISVQNGQFTTVEGNTNNDGGREGVAVMSHARPINDRYVFVRWADAVKTEAPPAKYQVVLNYRGVREELPSLTVNGQVLMAAREWGRRFSARINWDAEDGVVLWNGIEIPGQPMLREGVAYYPIRTLAQMSKTPLSVDANRRTVTIG